MGENQRLFEDSPIHPGKILKRLLEEKGWTQDELAEIIGRRRQTINEFIAGRTTLSPDLAVALAAAIGNTPAEWMKWDAAYRIAVIGDGLPEVRGKAKLYDLAPIRDMQKRGWIRETTDLAELEAELKRFFGAESLEDPPEFPVAMLRRSSLPFLSPAERVWCFRARKMAAAIIRVGTFESKRLGAAEEHLRELAAHPRQGRRISAALGEAGIRFVVVEPLPSTKIDGAAFWLDEHSPVIAISGRIDRIDNIWFTVMHEFAHIRNSDALSVDSDLLGVDKPPVLVEDEKERRANEQAAAALIGPLELESFIRRVGPLYSKTRIVQFANRLKIHPGIIVGQLQHREEMGYTALREFLVKMRDHIIAAALTDGWGHVAPVLGR